MNKYKFQYTKTSICLIIGIICLITYIFCVVYVASLEVNLFLSMAISFGISFLLFQLLKRKAIFNCRATLDETSVRFEFEENTKTINFSNLTSYEYYYGKNGPVLYLKNDLESFKIEANNNFCQTSELKLFCEDIIIKLKKYSNDNNLKIQNSSIFASKKMLIFLIFLTAIYLISFSIEPKEMKIYFGIAGGIYLIVFWSLYFWNKNEEQKKENIS